METKFNVGDILTDKNTSTRYRIICIGNYNERLSKAH